MKILFVICFFTCIKISSLEVTIPKYLKEPSAKTSNNSIERLSRYPVINGDGFRAIANHVIDETTTVFNTTKLQKGDVLFVGMPYLNYFIENIFPHVSQPFILITSNGSGTIDERYADFVKSPKLLFWFGRNIILSNEKIEIIPLGACWFTNPNRYKVLANYLSKVTSKSFFSTKKTHTLWGGAGITHPSRRPIKEYVEKCNFIKKEKRASFEIYMENMKNSKFVLSPRGHNIDCYRTWEALYAGSIPVVESFGIDSVYDGLPVIIVKDMANITKYSLNQEYEKLKLKKFNLKKLHMKYWIERVNFVKNQYIK